MALEVLGAALDVWLPAAALHPDPALQNLRPDPAEDAASRAALLGPGVCLGALNALVNSFDLVRRAAFDVLLRFPAPLPGFESPPAVARLLAWAGRLVDSPRARESDSGALLLQASAACSPHSPPALAPPNRTLHLLPPPRAPPAAAVEAAQGRSGSSTSA
jgi:hypothetical protein